MAVINLSVEQEDAISRLRSGCILRGGVGSGKSRTALAYYYVKYGGVINSDKYIKMINPPNLYIITTAKKRDDLEWEGELINFHLSSMQQMPYYKNLKITIDSWNNIEKYRDVKNSFFIFDEQRLVGYGKWVKTFLHISKTNKWILLTATPGDTWHDYIPVFIANGFYRNKTDFEKQHCVWSRFTNYPKIEKYIDQGRLLKYRNLITVEINYEKPTISHYFDIQCDYDKDVYDFVSKNRWNIFEKKPIENAGEYCLVLRKIVNSSVDRQYKLLDIVKEKKKVIIFYNHDYELDILRKLFDGYYPYAEWNGHKHQQILDSDHWVYLVQYNAGAEGWNCTTTDTMVFYSQSYSYKQMVQAAGRIDRRNTPFHDLYYYSMKSSSKIDLAISKTLRRKKKFSEKGFAPDFNNEANKHGAIQLDLFNIEPHSDFVDNFNNNVRSHAGRRIEDYCDEYNSWEDPERRNK